MTPGGGLAHFALVVALGAPDPASPPAPIPLRIAFEAPSDCSSLEAFYQGVRARTERVRLAEPGESATEIRVRMSQAGGSTHGELRMQGEKGETDTRRVDGGSCDEIVEALSLTAALALDPAARVAPAPAAAPEASPPPKPPPPVAPPEEEPLEEPSETGTTSLGLELGAKLMVGQVVSPFVTFGGELVARVRFVRGDREGPSLGLGFVRLQNDLFREPDDASIRFTGASLTGCPARWDVSGVLTLEPCALLVAGWIAAEGRNLSHTEATRRPYYAGGGSLTAGLPVGDVAFEISGGFTIPFVTRQFVTGQPGSETLVGETPAVSPFGGIGLAVGF